MSSQPDNYILSKTGRTIETRDRSMVKRPHCSYRGPTVNSPLHPPSSSRLSAIPFLENWTPSFDLLSHQSNMWCTYIQSAKTLTHKILKKQTHRTLRWLNIKALSAGLTTWTRSWVPVINRKTEVLKGCSKTPNKRNLQEITHTHTQNTKN